MRKCSSFMCVLIVLLAGGAEAQRPVAKEAVFGLVALGGLRGVDAWRAQDGCKAFSEIYADGEDLLHKMWNDAFEYSLDEANSYTMWWFEGGQAGVADAHNNPNDLITQGLGKTVPNQCHLDYWHKDAPTPEDETFTECHPWHASACCHNSTVVVPDNLKKGYGSGYEWDRCGPLSQACERFFIQEACFYECEVNAGLFRKFSDEQHDACSAVGVAQGATVTLASGSNYTCVPDTWGPGNAENKWQMYKMPIKASFADAWYRACANDLSCGTGDYFSCAGDYHAQLENEAAIEARLASECETGRNSSAECVAHLVRLAAKAQAEASTANADYEAALARAEAAQAALDQATGEAAASSTSAASKIPTWGVVILVIGGVMLLVFLAIIVYMYSAEKKGKPVFTSMKDLVDQNKTPNASSSSSSVSSATAGKA